MKVIDLKDSDWTYTIESSAEASGPLAMESFSFIFKNAKSGATVTFSMSSKEKRDELERGIEYHRLLYELHSADEDSDLLDPEMLEDFKVRRLVANNSA